MSFDMGQMRRSLTPWKNPRDAFTTALDPGHLFLMSDPKAQAADPGPPQLGSSYVEGASSRAGMGRRGRPGYMFGSGLSQGVR